VKHTLLSSTVRRVLSSMGASGSLNLVDVDNPIRYLDALCSAAASDLHLPLVHCVE
jgi:hypothetical protein